MISKLREHDQATLTAVGPKFDFEKVLRAGQSVLKTLMGRSSMRFPDQPPAALELEPGASTPLDDVALGLLADMFRTVHGEAYDAADLCVLLEFGPFCASWGPLGISALFGPVNNCVTVFEEPWEDLDVTPTILIHGRDKPFARMGRAATKFLKETLRADPYGTEIVFNPDELDADMVAVRFPHAGFGDGTGRIRVCRYLVEDFSIVSDGTGGRT